MINVERTQIRKETAWAILFTQPGGFTGHVMLLLMLLMFSTAHAKIRKQAYEAFWYTHHLVRCFPSLLVRDSTDGGPALRPSCSCSAFTSTPVSLRALISDQSLADAALLG